MHSLLLLLTLVSASMAAVAIYPIKAGQRLELDLGRNIVTWKRSRNGGPEEHIKHCGPTEKNVACAQFVTEDGKTAKPVSEARVESDGRLIIENVKSSDAGDYYSTDEPEHITKLVDGYAKTPRTRITVTVS